MCGTRSSTNSSTSLPERVGLCRHRGDGRDGSGVSAAGDARTGRHPRHGSARCISRSRCQCAPRRSPGSRSSARDRAAPLVDRAHDPRGEGHRDRSRGGRRSESSVGVLSVEPARTDVRPPHSGSRLRTTDCRTALSGGFALIEVTLIGLVLTALVLTSLVASARIQTAGEEAQQAAAAAAEWASLHGDVADAERIAQSMAPGAAVEVHRRGHTLEVRVSIRTSLVGPRGSPLATTVSASSRAVVSEYRSRGG